MINVKEVSYCYKDKQILDKISLHVGKGRSLALFGADDAGKTTLMQCMMGFCRKYVGHIVLKGKDVGHFPRQLCQDIRFVPDDIIRETHMTPDQYFAWAAKCCRSYDTGMQGQLCGKWKIETSKQLLDMTFEQNKLVQLIAVVCARPAILLLDEPGNYLSRKTLYEIMVYINGLVHDGMTVIAASETFAETGRFCQEYAYMKNGTICAHGMVENLVPWKIVTVSGGKESVIESIPGQILYEREGEKRWLYKGGMQELVHILDVAECEDWTVENVTLEEQLDADMSGWEW